MSEAAASIELTCPPDAEVRNLSVEGLSVFIDGANRHNFIRQGVAEVFGQLIVAENNFLSSIDVQAIGGIAVNTASKQVSSVNQSIGPYVNYSPFKMVRENDDPTKLITGVRLVTASDKREFYGTEAVDLSRLDDVQQTIRRFLASHPNQLFTVDGIREAVANSHPKTNFEQLHIVEYLKGMVRLQARNYAAVSNLRYGYEKTQTGEKGRPVFSWAGESEREQLKASDKTVSIGRANDTTVRVSTSSAKTLPKHIN